MGNKTRISADIKRQILHRIKAEGISANQAAREHGVHSTTVYSWLRRTADMPSNILQINKLKRENAELKMLLGEALLMQERSKKNQSRYAL